MIVRTSIVVLLATITLARAQPASRPATLPATRPACPYRTAHDAPLAPEEKQLQATDTSILYHVAFNGIRQNTRIPANLFLPADPRFSPPYPAMILQYGAGGNKNSNYIVAIARLAVAKGVAVLTIDAPNRGERRGKDDRTSFMDTNLFQYMGDCSRATDYLCARKDIDTSRLAYIGISWGAIAGLTYTAHDPRIHTVVSLVGGANFAGVLPGLIPEETRKETETYDPYYHIPLLAGRPLLLVNCTKDNIMPRSMVRSLHRAAPQGTQKVWFEADHIFEGVDRHLVCNQVIDFVIQSQAAPPAQPPRN